VYQLLVWLLFTVCSISRSILQLGIKLRKISKSAWPGQFENVVGFYCRRSGRREKELISWITHCNQKTNQGHKNTTLAYFFMNSDCNKRQVWIWWQLSINNNYEEHSCLKIRTWFRTLWTLFLNLERISIANSAYENTRGKNFSLFPKFLLEKVFLFWRIWRRVRPYWN
jgi:hypothetical protein